MTFKQKLLVLSQWMAWQRLTLCTQFLSSWLGHPEVWRPGEGFFRVGGAWVQDVRLPAAARLQGGGAVGPLRPGEPSYWMFASNGNFGGSSNSIWTYNRYVWRYSISDFHAKWWNSVFGPLCVCDSLYWANNQIISLSILHLPSAFTDTLYIHCAVQLRTDDKVPPNTCGEQESENYKNLILVFDLINSTQQNHFCLCASDAAKILELPPPPLPPSKNIYIYLPNV